MDPSEAASIMFVERVDGVSVGRVVCPALSQREAPIVQDEAAQAAGGTGWRLVLDCTRLTFISSMGLGTLVTLTRQCREKGGKAAFFGFNPELLELVRLTKLDKFLVLCKDEAEALAKAGAK